ncbi:MAG: glycoside hydrolase family 3 C-terminal domain-containing protein [Mobilitalea sp.]
MKKLLVPLIILFLIIGVLLDVIAPRYESSLSVAFTESNVDEEVHESVLEYGYELNQTVQGEGVVLLRNENGTLPIITSEVEKIKVNVFGVRSAHLVLNSAGSASGSNEETATLKDGLEAANFEVNLDLWTMLNDYSLVDNASVNEGGTSEAVKELAVSEYTGNCSFESAKEYSEYAIVTFSRLGGEGADQARTGMGENGDQSYLELTTNEKELLATLKEKGFKVIVLINSSYAMELGPIEEYDVDAALWIGGPGVKGALAVGQIIAGGINPSGRLVDTYPYDLTTSSTFITSDKYAILGDDGEAIGGYTDYAEGIYYGYRWYETTDAENFWGSDFAENRWNIKNGYEDVIQYPFGYGLSYTTFAQEWAENPVYDEETSTFTFQVKVTNTGDYVGKEVVQLYAETPYIDGGVEKSKVVLIAFDKTDTLETSGKEAYQIIALTVSAEELASYDETAANGGGAYVLDAGAYTFYLSNGETGVHCWVDPVASYTQTLSEVVYSGDSKRTSDLITANNQLTEGATRNGEKIVILSRSKNFANAEETVFTEKEDITIVEGSELFDALVTNQSKAGDYLGEILSDLSVAKAGTLTLGDMVDKEVGYSDYDDERWDKLISQMSIDDMILLTGTGGWSTAAVESIGKEVTTDIDGPYGLSNLIKNSMGVDVSCVSYCTEVVMASTWNTELLKKIGQAVAEEAETINTSGWYAPGANIHRTPFGGRNAEYYSEDPLLSGEMCAAEVNGALSKGLYVYVKHFAFNETEANRTSKQNCYIDEQTAREIYLKSFETAIKNDAYDEDGNKVSYGATGLMASYMWYEEKWLGADYSLMTTILRDEWGFNGMVITDNAAVTNVNKWITLNKSLFGGTDLMLVYKTAKMAETASTSDEGITALKTGSKHILWTMADAASRRGVDAQIGKNWWPTIFTVANIIIYGMAALLTCCLIISKNKKRKKSSPVI